MNKNKINKYLLLDIDALPGHPCKTINRRPLHFEICPNGPGNALDTQHVVPISGNVDFKDFSRVCGIVGNFLELDAKVEAQILELRISCVS